MIVWSFPALSVSGFGKIKITVGKINKGSFSSNDKLHLDRFTTAYCTFFTLIGLQLVWPIKCQKITKIACYRYLMAMLPLPNSCQTSKTKKSKKIKNKQKKHVKPENAAKQRMQPHNVCNEYYLAV